MRIVATDAGHEGTVGRIVEIFGLLPHAIHAVVLHATGDTASTRAFVTLEWSAWWGRGKA
jgi:hypothetical protein